AGLGNDQLARRIPAPPIYAMTCPPHEVSYSTMEKLQYGGSQAQESEQPASTCSVHVDPMRPHLSANLCSALTFAAVAVPSSGMFTADHAAIQYRAVPPGEAAHFVSAGCRLDAEERPDIAFAANLRARRSCVRARRGRVAHRDQR